MDWNEGRVLHTLGAVLSVGSFGFFVVRYFIKQIKELIDDLRNKPTNSL